LTEKEKKPKSEKDSATPESTPKKVAPPAGEPEVIAPEESIPPALAPSRKSKKEKQSSNLWGVVIFFFLIIAAGIGAGGFYLYQEQMKFQNETLAKLSKLEAQLNALDTEADQARQNKQSLDTLNQELQQFKTEMDTTLKTHQSSLVTLDEDVMRLKEKIEIPVETPPASPPVKEEIRAQPEPLPGELLPESPNEETSADTEPKKDDPDHKSQKFVEWMENFFAAIWNWFAGLFS
jgi:TolA-binding protein